MLPFLALSGVLRIPTVREQIKWPQEKKVASQQCQCGQTAKD